MNPIRACILTLSDRCARGEREDKSGPALAAMVREKLGGKILETKVISDDAPGISAQLKVWSQSPAPDLILTTGGTGLAPRDVTPEATLAVLERRHSGLMELVRLRCLPKTVKTFLSRGEAGAIGGTLVINLPGSPRGATECLEALLDILPHAIETLRGDVKDG